MNLYALDIETDNSDGNGLDPRKAAITSAAVAYDGGTWFCEAGPDGERALLDSLSTFLRGMDPGVLVTWNGSNFDLPFLVYRFGRNEVHTPPTLLPAADRPPKYPRGPDDYHHQYPGHPEGGWYAVWHGHKHADIAYPYQQVAEDARVKWSLKPVAQYRGLDPVVLDAARLHEATPAERMAYNLSDVAVTLELAKRLGKALPVDPLGPHLLTYRELCAELGLPLEGTG